MVASTWVRSLFPGLHQVFLCILYLALSTFAISLTRGCLFLQGYASVNLLEIVDMDCALVFVMVCVLVLVYVSVSVLVSSLMLVYVQPDDLHLDVSAILRLYRTFGRTFRKHASRVGVGAWVKV